MRSNAGKTSRSTTSNKSTSRSSKPKRSNSVPKNPVSRDNGKAADELDGNIVCDESRALQSEASAVVLEKTGTAEGTGGTDLPSELTAITLHQPWASLIAMGKKHYETRDWATDYRGPIAIHAAKKLHEDESLISLLEIPAAKVPLGAVVAIADLTDCILMDEEFILKQSSFEQYLGLWEIGRYAWKLENVRVIEPIPATGKQGLWKWEHRQNWEEKLFGIEKTVKYLDESDSWNPTDFGELHHVAEADGQLNLLEWVDPEPPEPGDYEFREQFEEAFKEWAARQTDEAEEELANFGVEELCNQLMDGSTCVQELGPASPMLESNCGEEAPTSSANGTTTASDFSKSDSLEQSNLPISNSLTLSAKSPSPIYQESSQLPPPASPLAMMGSDSQQTTIETASPTYSEQSETCSPTSQLSKTLSDSSIVPIPPATNPEPTSDSCSIPYPRAGTMQNGQLSVAPILPPPGVESESLLLRSPGGLSSGEGTRPPGKSRLETQLNQLGLIQDGEVAAPEFLEAGYNLPMGWTNPQEKRTALELAQVQAQQLPIGPSLESQAEIQTTAIEEQPWAMPLTGELQQLPLSGLNISPALPVLDNIGSFSKDDLLNFAITAHESIAGIERSELELAMRKLNQARIAGTCLTEFKKRCRHGEFGESVSTVINLRTAQTYMSIAENWNLLAEASRETLLVDGQILGINWARDTIAQNKKSLKSAAPPKDPDGWRTPDTSDQPVVSLVKKALGGQIYLDPASDSGCNIPATMRYFKWNDGLAKHNIWEKTVFVNPPFSDPFPWVERCCFEIARGNVSAAVMLLKAGVISNVGTGELINKYASAICHWRGRINFLNDEGNAVKGSDFDCVFVYFGTRLDLFRQAFGGRGTIATIENHYSSVNKKYLLKSEIPQFGNTQAEQKQLAAAVGLGNGRSVLPDMRDADRERNERYDPHTVVDVPSMPTPAPTPAPISNNLSQPIAEPEIFDETPLAVRQFETAKNNCLNDYIIAISSNLSAFSDEQISFLTKIINEESAKRIGF